MNVDSKDKVKGVPVTIVVLFALSGLGIPAACVAGIACFAYPILIVAGQWSWSWWDAFYIVLFLIGARLMVSAMLQLHQVMDAYSLLEDLRTEVSAKDPELLTKAERGVLQFFEDGKYVRW